MSVVEFRASLQGYWKVLTVTLRFRNKLGRPVVLGYVQASGGATDDRGNRYAVKDSEVRGIGLIAGKPDDKFVLSPGRRVTRFTLAWADSSSSATPSTSTSPSGRSSPPAMASRPSARSIRCRSSAWWTGPRRALRGPVARGRASLLLSLGGHVVGAHRPRGSPAAGTQAAPTTFASPFGASPTAGGTTGGARCPAGASCQDAGAFSVTVMQTIPAQSGKTKLVRFAIRVKHQTAQPLVLAYKAGTNAAVDEQGNAFTWGKPGTHDGSAQGIGTIEGARIDPQFQIAAGATRDAQIAVSRADATRPPGKSYLDTVLVGCARPEGSGRRSGSTRFICSGRIGCGSGGGAEPGQTTCRRPAVAQGPARGSDPRRRMTPSRRKKPSETRTCHQAWSCGFGVVRRERHAHPGTGLEVHDHRAMAVTYATSLSATGAHGPVLGTGASW
jgi:hypothetical protein